MTGFILAMYVLAAVVAGTLVVAIIGVLIDRSAAGSERLGDR